jgi:FkbM family methyltransferase
MRPGRLLDAALFGCAPASRAIVALSLRGRLPQRIADHWRVRQALPRLFPDGVLSTMNGALFHVPAAMVQNIRIYEPVTARLIESNLSGGMVFADVGANVGYFSVVAARTGATVHAFEPVPASLALLRKNLARHGAHDVTVHAIALGKDATPATIYVTREQFMDGIVPSPYAPPIGTIAVERRRLDDLALGRIDLLKIDIEGGEMDALAGMTRTIRDNPQLGIVVEWSPACMRAAGQKPDDLPDFLRDHGLTDIVALDNFDDAVRSVEDMAPIFAADPLAYCNLSARRPV